MTGGFLLPDHYSTWVYITGKTIERLIELEKAEPLDRHEIYMQKLLCRTLFIEHGYTAGISPYERWTGADYKERLEKEIAFVFANAGNFWDYDRSIL